MPEAARAVALRALVDAAGLCLAARSQTYIQQVIDGWDSDGPCTALGQSRALDAAGAALVNGVAIHGEDFADPLEGAPIRVGAMVIPAVLPAAEHHRLSDDRALVGLVAGMEDDGRASSRDSVGQYGWILVVGGTEK